MTRKGNIYNREEFLHTIAKNLQRERKKEAIIKPSWTREPQWDVLSDKTQDELVEVLKEQCQRIHTHFIKSDTSSLQDDLLHVFQKYNAKSVVSWDDKAFDEFGIASLFSKAEHKLAMSSFVWNSEKPQESRRAAEQADIGLTFSDMTLAESGTLVLLNDEKKGRSVSLLPKIHIAIVPKSTIVPRLSQATRTIHQKIKKGEIIPSCINFISGPSNSADIEMNLVVGVHGPLEAVYILVEDK